jgi:hypothetical protein
VSAGRPRLLIVTVVAFVLGAGLMLPFEFTITRLLGVISFAVFVVCGLLTVANPAFLEGDGADDRR